MTIADLLGRMELLDNELETGSSEDDETAAILALDVAQDHLETLLAAIPKVFAGSATGRGTVATAADTESSTYPTGLLRLDSLWNLDTASYPSTKMHRIFESGGHAPNTGNWPYRVHQSKGDPWAYWTDEVEIFWDPKPDAVYTKRYYGLVAKTNLTLRTQTFGYADYLAMPMATFATRVLSLGVGDDTDELQALATDLFTPALRKARRFSRERPGGRVYSTHHTT